MFTGIVETTAIVKDIITTAQNKTFVLASSLSQDLKIDQSVSHNGVCLTVEKVENQQHWVTAIKETLDKTTLNTWQKGDIINLERCMLINARVDGHLVQGHVDATAICTQIIDAKGSWNFIFAFDEKFAPLIVEKGSVCINGISLTCFNITPTTLEVSIIPYTFEHTTMQYLRKGDAVNIEFDVIGKYVQRNNSLIKK